MIDRVNQKKTLEKAAFTFEGCLTNPMEGYILGNGDMAANVTVMQTRFGFF